MESPIEARSQVTAPSANFQAVVFLWLASVVIISITLTLIIFKVNPQDGGVYAVHYNVLFGVDEFGGFWEIMLLPITAASLTLMNWLLSRFIFKKVAVVRLLLAITSVLISLIVLVASVLLIRIN